MDKKISIVVSVYNEEDSIPLFYPEVMKVLPDIGWDYELIFVNDGSADNSRAEIYKITQENPRVKAIHFSRNFGHEAAMIAGIDHASGDGIICLDADLQHPPALIGEIVKKLQDGYDVISMVRTRNESAGMIKNVTSSGFYSVINSEARQKCRRMPRTFSVFPPVPRMC